MSDDKKNKALKIVICGEGGVGKTSLIETFQEGRFIADTTMTIAVQFHVKRMKLTGGDHLSLQIWDLGGQRNFLEMGVFGKYCQGAHAAMICFDLSDLDTLEEIPRWLALLPSEIPKILVGTKKDKGESMEDLVEAYLEDFDFQGYIETSSKDNIESVFKAFEKLLTRVLSSSVVEAPLLAIT